MLCGFYPEASLEFGVALDEFETMGSEAYQKLASIEFGEDEMIYEYLATNFDQVTGLLCHISGLSGKSVRRQGHKTTEDYEEVQVRLLKNWQAERTVIISTKSGKDGRMDL